MRWIGIRIGLLEDGAGSAIPPNTLWLRLRLDEARKASCTRKSGGTGSRVVCEGEITDIFTGSSAYVTDRRTTACVESHDESWRIGRWVD